MPLQPLFRRFHEAILLKNTDENDELKTKRDRVLTRLREKLHRKFTWFNQGSYAMGTGVKPLRGGDYDIDVGIVFDLGKDPLDPVTVKGWVYEAVKSHTARVEWRWPCITVYYSESHKTSYHVDLAVFRKDPKAPEGSERLLLAFGKQNAAPPDREWQLDDRRGFIKRIEGRFAYSEDAAQFRRVIRYLKRWKDVHFPADGRAAPSGNALTTAAERWFVPQAQGKPRQYDDLAATLALVQAMLKNFRMVEFDGKQAERLVLPFPVLPHDDVFARLSNEQMTQFKGRLVKLAGWLEEARRTGSTEPLRRAFGDDFPEE